MFFANVSHNSVKVLKPELLTRGSSKANYIFFNFSEAWDGLKRIAVFKTSEVKIAIELETNQKVIAIPWECYKTVGETIFVGAYGMNSKQEVLLPTTWAELGTVADSVTIVDYDEPSPSRDILMLLVDTVEALGEDVETYSKHPNLKNRSTANQHPISAVTNLSTKLDERFTADDYLTEDDIRELIGGVS